MNKSVTKKVVITKSVEILKVLVFVAVFLFLLRFISDVFFPRSVAMGYYHRRRDAYSFVRDRRDSIQVVATGNSDLYSAFSPLDLWDKYGYTSTVCASGRQTIQQSQFFVSGVFEKQSPGLVIIETDMFYDYSLRREKMMGQPGPMDETFDRLDPELFDNEIVNMFSVFEFHNVIHHRESSSKPMYNTHGYKYSSNIQKLRHRDYMKKTDKSAALSSIKIEQMDKLVAFCRDNGAEVLLVEVPSVSSWNYARHNAVAKYAESRELDFVDMNLFYEELGISFDYSYRDNGNHLNYYGALAVTDWLGNYIKENYGFESKKGLRGYNSWDVDSHLFTLHVNSSTPRSASPSVSFDEQPDDEGAAPETTAPDDPFSYGGIFRN